MLLVIRACSQLHMEPIDNDIETPIRPGCTIRLSNGYSLFWAIDGTQQITINDTAVVRFVPLVHALEQAENDSAVGARLAAIGHAASQNPMWTIILHPANPGDTTYPRIAGVGNPPACGIVGAVDFVRVSPFSLDNVERVARAVRWSTLVPNMLAYPPLMPEPPTEIKDSISPWLQRRNDSKWALVSPLLSSEADPFGLTEQLRRAISARDRYEAEKNTVVQQLRDARDDRRRTAELNRQKARLRQPLEEAASRVEALELFKTKLEDAQRTLAKLTICPACRKPARFESRSGDCFLARCTSDGCRAKWELRLESASETRIPVFLPGGIHMEEWASGKPSQWVDDVLGCDVLAIPIVEGDGDLIFGTPRASCLSQ